MEVSKFDLVSGAYLSVNLSLVAFGETHVKVLAEFVEVPKS